MVLFSKKPQYTQQEVDEITRYRPEQNTRIEYSLGTSDLDELLQYHAPKHEAALKDLQETQKQILENQREILRELANLRHIYQTPENEAAPKYSR